MKLLTLEIPPSINKIPTKPSSYLNNFPDKTLFYFQIPDDITEKEQKFLFQIGCEFLKSQFLIPQELNFENLVKINDENILLDHKPLTQKIPWNIFFTYGKWIKVKSGVFDQSLAYDISDFTGKIINFFSGECGDVYQIAFSGNSLMQIPQKKLLELFNYFSPFYTYLETDMIIPSPNTFDENYDQRIKIEMLRNFFGHKKPANPNKSFLDKSDNLIELINYWDSYLDHFLQKSDQVFTMLSDRKTYQLLNISCADEFLGVWGDFRRDDNLFLFPLAEVLTITNNQEFQKILKQYKELMNLILPNYQK